MTAQVASLKVHEEEPIAASLELPHRRFLRATDATDQPAGDLRVVEREGRPTPSVMWRETLHRRLLAVADVATATATLVVLLSAFGQRRVAFAALAGSLLLVLLFKMAGLYDRDELRLVHSTLDEVPLLVQVTGLFALGLALVHAFLFGGSMGAEQIAAVWLSAFAAIILGRTVARTVAGLTSPTERCLVIGELGPVERIRAKLASSGSRARVIASLPLNDESLHTQADTSELIRYLVEDFDVDRIIIAPLTSDTGEVVEMIRIAKAVGVRVSVLPRIFEVVGSAVEFDDVDGMTMLGVRRFGLTRSSRSLKRAFDLALGSLVLLVLGPVILGIMLAIRLDSPGPVFFRQVRVGRDGRHFRIFKFRSMVEDAETRKETLRSLNEAGDGLFKITHDPRITRVGRILRETSLDELPQLFNVLRGEMSLVGPRPLVVDEDARVLGLDRSRLHLTPGMTGPWQVLGRRVPMQEMVGIDYLYVANWSMWRDLKIMLRTARHVVRRGNL